MPPLRITDYLRDKAASFERVLDGKDCICTHAGTSQYSGVGSSSACGLVAMNCVRYILSLELQGISGAELVKRMLMKDTMEEIMSICLGWTSDGHLEVDDVYNTPLFKLSLKLVRTEYGKAGKMTFEKMLRHLDQLAKSPDEKRSCAVVITRPPEIVTCMKIAHPSVTLYVIFDSHPRTTHPAGAAFFFTGSLESAAQHLSDLFPVDPRLLSDSSGLQWQAELLAHVSGHFFESSRNDMRMSKVVEQAFMEASCASLSVKAQESETQSHYALLASENERLKKELNLMEERMELVKHERADRAVEQEELRELREAVYHVPPIPDSGDSYAWRVVLEHRSSKENFACRDAHATQHSLVTHGQSTLPSFQDKWGQLSQTSSASAFVSNSRAKGKERASCVVKEDDFEMVARMQLEYQAEDIALAAQMLQLRTTSVQQTFDCSICMDELPIDDVARIDGCEHSFCRACIRQYITSKFDERKFPMLCPRCSAEKDGGHRVISQTMIHQIGISEDAYAIFNELQITKFSVPIQCRKCKLSAFVDRLEFEGAKILFCPFPNCSYSWCKDCQQEVDVSAAGPLHSCDGSEELGHLMSQHGWKVCPTCKTPTEKTGGCNHMKCGSPGCNTHFCYICGGLIIQSTGRSEIRAQVEQHYRTNCHLFHVPPEN